MTDDLGQPPPVEPMGDLAWTRIERGLWARLDVATPIASVPKRSRRWVWIAAPALALAAAAAFALFVDPSGELPANNEPEAPTRIVSGAAPSTISIGDAHVTLDANSAVVMSPAGNAAAVVERGAAWFAIAPRTGRPFIVTAGDTTVRVIGTRFRVARSEEHATVEVEHGTVEVTFHGTTLKVSAGHSWSSQLPSTVTERTQTAAAEPPARAPEVVPDPVAPVAPGAGTPPRAAKPAKPAKPASEAIPITAIDLDRLKYDRFVALEARDPAAALAGYLELSRGSSRWAPVALFAAGRLAADRRDARAKTLLGIYLQRFPSGANADDARKLLDRLKGASR